METQKRLKFTEKLAYGLADFPEAANSILAAFLTMFYTDSLGMAAGAVGTMFFISKLFDGISDILAGILIDKTRTKWGKARPWLLWLSVPTGLSLALIFFVPQGGSDAAKMIYAFLTYNLFTAVMFTITGIARSALLALSTQDTRDRASMATFGMFFGLGSTILGISAVFPMIFKLGGDVNAWRVVFIGYGIIVTLGLLAVIGLGRIGAGVAKRAQSFDMNVIAYDPFVSDERAKNLGVKLVELDELFKTADFITVHMPLTNKTRDMISLAQMKIMKPTVRLINCARGGIINENDLATALMEKIIAGAAIDVFDNEPLAQDSPLRNLPNIILTPHLGASTVEAQIGVSVDVAKGIIDALNNKPVASAVNLPHIPSHILEKLAPFLDLGERLGRTITGLSKEPISSVQVKVNGKIADMNSSLISTAVLKGMLTAALDTNVNLVNANILAAERGIHLSEIKSSIARDFANLLTVSANGNIVTGTLFGNEGRIVSINNFRVDVDPHARILICPHINRPGVIGSVGMLLAKHGINISGMQVGKTAIEGTSLMVLTVDNPISQDVLDEVKSLDPIFDVTPVYYDF